MHIYRLTQHGDQAQLEINWERANRLKQERRASLDPVEKEAVAQLRWEYRWQQDPATLPGKTVPVEKEAAAQNINQETARERANRLKRERRASLDPVEKEAAAQNTNQETARERANHLKRERCASLDPVETKAAAQLRREYPATLLGKFYYNMLFMIEIILN